MTHKEAAVLSYLKAKSSLQECLTHFPGLAQQLRIAVLSANTPLGGREVMPGAIFDVFPPEPAPDFEPKGRSILSIVASDSATNGFKDHLVYINGHTLTGCRSLDVLWTERLKCTFVHPGPVQVQAKSLLIDSIISKTARLSSNVVQIEASNEQRFFLTLHRTSDGLLLTVDS